MLIEIADDQSRGVIRSPNEPIPTDIVPQTAEGERDGERETRDPKRPSSSRRSHQRQLDRNEDITSNEQ